MKKFSLLQRWMVYCFIFPSAVFSEGIRDREYLNGRWERTCVKREDNPFGSYVWKKVKVPDGRYVQDIKEFGKTKLLYRTPFSTRSPGANEQVFLCFESVQYRTTVWLDGRKTGTELDTFNPFEFDITAFLKTGKEHLLSIEVEDWTSTAGNPLNLTGIKTELEAWGRMNHQLLAPVGCNLKVMGLMGRVWMERRPKVRLEKPIVQSSWQERKLTIFCPVANQSSQPAKMEIIPKITGPNAPKPASKALVLPAGKTTTVVFSCPWPTPHVWSFEDPFLYRLELKLQGDISDRIEVRFGFREIQAKGDKLVLNGIPMVPCMASTGMDGGKEWGRWVLSPEDIRLLFRRTLEANVRLFRCHGRPWPEYTYDIADEMGLMIVPESAFWTWNAGGGDFFNPIYWKNARKHLTGMVQTSQNHPSVIMYSIENEMIRTEDQPARTQAMRKGLVKLGRYVKSLDPTRLIQYSFGADGYGTADVINLHYPREPGEGHCYPNDWYWLEGPVKFRQDRIDELSPWTWDRKKPLIIGEYGAFDAATADTAAIWFGPKAFEQPDDCLEQFKRLFWTRSAEAYRWYGAVASPWHMYMQGFRDRTPLLTDCQKAFRPLAVLVRPFYTRYYSGAKFSRHLMLVNDTLSRQQFELTCRLGTSEWRKIFDLNPAERYPVLVEFPCPEVMQKMNTAFVAALRVKGKSVDQPTVTISIFPRPAPPDFFGWAVHDPKKHLDTIWAFWNISSPPLWSPSFSGKGIIIGSGKASEHFKNFARQGGTLLVMTPDDPAKFLPTAMEFDPSHAATMVFSQNFPDPWKKDLDEKSFWWWAEDHMVCRGDLVISKKDQATPLLVTAGFSPRFPNQKGLAWTPLVHIPYGKGQFIVSRLLIAENIGSEPAAAVLLRNIISNPFIPRKN